MILFSLFLSSLPQEKEICLEVAKIMDNASYAESDWIWLPWMEEEELKNKRSAGRETHLCSKADLYCLTEGRGKSYE